MAEKPTLDLTYDKDGQPVSGNCSGCGVELGGHKPANATFHSLENWLRKCFALHFKARHSGEVRKE